MSGYGVFTISARDSPKESSNLNGVKGKCVLYTLSQADDKYVIVLLE